MAAATLSLREIAISSPDATAIPRKSDAEKLYYTLKTTRSKRPGLRRIAGSSAVGSFAVAMVIIPSPLAIPSRHDAIKEILMRQTKFVPSTPDAEEALRLLDEIFGGSEPDPIGDALHAASMAANSDEEKLYYCLKYAHHTGKRKRGHKTVETLVNRALRLPGRGPDRRAMTA